MKPSPFIQILSTTWRGLVVGCVFMLAQMVAGMLLGMLGLIKPGTTANSNALVWMFLAAVVIGITLGIISRKISASRPIHILIWSCIVFLNLGSVMVEGAYFAPEQVQIPVAVLAIQQFIVAIFTGISITLLFVPRNATKNQSPAGMQQTWFAYIWRFAASAFSYLVFYFVFGSINYNLVTRPYYETHAGGLAVPEPMVVLLVELIRAPLIVLSVVPFLHYLSVDRKNTIILTGLVLFIVGGVAPLLFQVTNLPLVLLLASAVEIFLQNFLTGVVTAILLRRSRGKATFDQPA